MGHDGEGLLDGSREIDNQLVVIDLVAFIHVKVIVIDTQGELTNRGTGVAVVGVELVEGHQDVAVAVLERQRGILIVAIPLFPPEIG